MQNLSKINEPALDEILSDPVTQSVMHSYGISPGFLRELCDKTGADIRKRRAVPSKQ